MIRLCVIGNPIFHSKSPEIHTELLRKAGIAGCYSAVRVLPEELPEFVHSAKAGAWDGFNVTMPHKETILPLLDEISPTAKAIGGVNTVVIHHGQAVGHNTDAPGLLEAINGPVAGKTALILGFGGAGKAAAYALSQAGATVKVCCRHPKAGQYNWNKLADLAPGCDLLVNATPLGMIGGEKWPDFGFLDGMAHNSLVFDMVYGPAPTALTAEAQRRGLAAMDGRELLQKQAEIAFSLFTAQCK